MQRTLFPTFLETVKVYKPEITFRDSALDLNTVPSYDIENYADVVWKNNGSEPTNAILAKLGNASALTYTYNPPAAALTEDTPVTVKAVRVQEEAASPNGLKHSMPATVNIVDDAVRPVPLPVLPAPPAEALIEKGGRYHETR